MADRYRIYCTTDAKYEYEWADAEPTQCPVNGAHTIDSASIAVVEQGGNGQLLHIAALLPQDKAKADVTGVDYKSGLTDRLHKKIKTRFRGEIREVDYYTDDTEATKVLTVQVYSDSGLTTLGYDRDASGLAIQRWTKRTWWQTDDTAGPTKTTHKRYDHDTVEQMTEGRRRRTNVINSLQLDVLSMLVATTAVDPNNPTQAEKDAAEADGMDFMGSYASEISTYISTGDLDWRTPPESPNITDDATAWLSNNVTAYGWTGPTIRDEILAALVEITDP